MFSDRCTVKRALLLAGLIFLALVLSAAQDQLEVLRITPSGENVSELRQIVFEFNRPVVALGNMHRDSKEIPITITPHVNCEWRWLNQTALSCNLDAKNALIEATKYDVVVNPGLIALDKAAMGQAYKHSFTTLLPRVEEASVKIWKSPTHPTIRVKTNLPTTEKALQSVLRIVGEGTPLMAPVHVKETVELDWRGNPIAEFEHRVFEIDAAAELPKGANVSLHASAGLTSLKGGLKGTQTETLISFQTFGDFALLGVACFNTHGHPVTVNSYSHAVVCDANARAELVFNAPVSSNKALSVLQITPSIPGLLIDDSEVDAGALFDRLTSNHTAESTYRISLPRLKPSQKYRISLKPGLRDVFERDLTNTPEIEFTTGHLHPHFSMPYQYVVLEKDSENDLSVGLTNLDSWEFSYQGMNSNKSLTDRYHTKPVTKILDLTMYMPLRIRDILENRSGAVYGELWSQPKLSDYPGTIFAQVTPFQVHMKLGHFNSTVWVTELSTGKVVQNAKVTWYEGSFKNLASMGKVLGVAQTDANGLATLPGKSAIDSKRNEDARKLFVRVDKSGEMALLPLIYDFETSSYRASNGTVWGDSRGKGGHTVVFGTTAQGIHRLGDKIQYKIYVREQANEGLKSPSKKGYSLKVHDPMGKIVHEVAHVTLSAFGATDGEFVIPRNGVVGWYQVALTLPSGQTDEAMSVLVSDFTPAPFHVAQELNGDTFVAERAVKVTTSAHLHSGGAFADAPAKVVAHVDRIGFYPKTQVAKGFDFSNAPFGDNEYTKQVFEYEGKLDKSGELRSEFVLPKLVAYYGKLNVESSVQDDRGKSISAVSSGEYAGVDRFVGLKSKDRFEQAGSTVDASYIVVDVKGNAIAKVPVSIVFERQQNNLVRIKDVGNTYTTHVETTWIKEGECNGVSGKEANNCTFKTKKAGSYRLIAHIKDTQGREHVTQSQLWIAGETYVAWDEKNENFLDIVAEKGDAVVGETARFFIKNPYPNAKALITVERYGVIDTFVKTLDSSSAIIEIPVKESYVPGFYLSVTIQSPRVAKAPKTGLDLGKPTFSMGYIEVPVVDRYKEIQVTAKTDSEVYRPREKVKLTLAAKPKAKNAKREDIELAVAVVDEAVFDLVSGGEKNYDVYRGLYPLHSLDLTNYSLLTRLITRQALETKGANPGGGGGSGVDIPARSLFKLLSYWNPSVKTDAEGNATVEFEAPDNLTGWRVLAMAVTPSDKAGHSSARFKVNRPTEIRPAMANQVSEGDSLFANFTVMNRTDKARDLTVTIQASGDVQATQKFQKVVTLAAYERQSISMPVIAKSLSMNRNLDQGAIRFVVRAGDSVDADAMEHVLPVQKKRSFETSAVYGSTVADQAKVELAFPQNIFTDVGQLDVVLSPTVLSSIEGAFRYMRDYPYTCWEQKLTKALSADNYQRLKEYVSKDFTWEKSSGLAQETLDLANAYQAAKGGMAYFIANDHYVDPYLSAYTALAFHWMRQNGKQVPVTVEKRLHSYLLGMLRRDETPGLYNEATTATMRATALYALAAQGKVSLTDLQRFEPKFSVMSLFGQAHFVEAALLIPGAQKIAKDKLKEMLSQTTQTSGKFLFSGKGGTGFERILSTPIRSNCAALDMLVSVAKKDGLQAVGDTPIKLVRSISESRKGREYFENTQENIYCMHALANYASVFEVAPVKMKVSASVGKQEFGKAALASKTANPVTLTRPIDKNDPGTKPTLQIDRKGEGRLYYAAQMTYAPKDAGTKAVNAGMALKRTYSVWRDKKWVEVKSPLLLKRGETVRVDLNLSLFRPGNFVVVNDPIPGALEPVNSLLATSSGGEVRADGFYHNELLNNAARFYSDYLPAGEYALSYTAQVIADGKFTAMPPLAQEMYNPDVLGKDVLSVIEVK